MNISTLFWIATIIMALLAFGFIATPLIRSNHRTSIVGVALALPAFAAGFYYFVGAPDTTGGSVATRESGNTETVGSVASMVDGLAEKLRQNPDDGKSWLLLARSYEHLNRIAEATAAYERAVALGEHDTGLAAMVSSPGSTTASSAQVFGNLRLSERSKKIVQPTDTVFIFARAVDGPPMPIAVLQRSVADLPLDFLLNDSQAMTANFRLSDFEQVIVTARISRSGNATEALQDLEAKTNAVVIAENQHLNLIIE